MTASVVFYYKNALIIIKEKKRMKLHYQKIFFSIDMKLTYGKGNCNRNSNICNATCIIENIRNGVQGSCSII